MKDKIIRKFDEYKKLVEQLLNDLEKQSPEALNHKPEGGGWSALQVAYHLVLAEELSLAYTRKKMSFQPAMKPVGISEHWRSWLLTMYLRTPIKFKAPPAVGGKDSVFPTVITLEVVQKKWKASLDEWAVFFEEMPSDMANKAIYKHPRAGVIGWLHLVNFFQVHLQRHQRQIARTLKAAR